ncbi:MAG: hypothetical protein QW051_04545 [Candidatus Aenigmatarchaeota archaeon]
MEKLNLSNGKRRVLKLKTFVFILLISCLPALSLIYLSVQIKILKVGELIRKYPVVFNNLTDLSINSLDQQIDNLKSSFERKANKIISANQVVKNYILELYRDSYFLKYFSLFSSGIPNKIFVREFMYDDTRFYVDFYEYGIETKVSTSTIYNDLSKMYNNVVINLIEERNFFSNIKYFHYNLEGTK